ncbi:MAG: DUF1684 domain-containing protein [Leadbetterella sp.]|nr:DUF1684 domain-containing protein [Leadbetterella sp.]
MKKERKTVLMLLVIYLFVSVAWVPDEDPYKKEIDDAHARREAALKAENGWLNVSGLFWLKEGNNKVGATPGFEVRFPDGKALPKLGELHLENGVVTFISDSREVLLNGKAAEPSAIVFNGEGRAPVLQYGSLKWFIIKRGDLYAVRLRDLESEAIKNFRGISRYPVNKEWRVTAKFRVPSNPRTITVWDITGSKSEQPLAGEAVFKWKGTTYKLQATGTDRLFFVFGDLTNRHETYGGGRFLYADAPDADGNVILDFNKAVNPPCAFTDYATCPKPTKENHLSLAVTAGEKKYGDH